MKQIITEKDIPSLVGRFIVQLNNDDTEADYTEVFRKNPFFWLEKRISFISYINTFGLSEISGKKERKSYIVFNGFYYSHGVYKTPEEFVFKFNHYVDGDSKDTRYHRLLTNRELDWLNEELKKQK
ncbi:MAG TPA: hypothetical protein PKH91_04225 [Flavobacterium sp.]|nr:hypothetical protein [Flavobacterium sp.]